MRVLVCGGRSFGVPLNDASMTPEQVAEDNARYRREEALLNETLHDLNQRRGITVLIHGCAPGADSLAEAWADYHCVWTLAFPADWNRHGKAAGPLRNQRMLDEGKPDVVIAFKGGRGTADMVRRARAAGVEVIEV